MPNIFLSHVEVELDLNSDPEVHHSSHLGIGFEGLLDKRCLHILNLQTSLRVMPLVMRSAIVSSVKNSSKPCSLAIFPIASNANQNLNLTWCMDEDSIAGVAILGDLARSLVLIPCVTIFV